MPSLPLSERLMREAVQAVHEHGSKFRAAEALGIPRSTLQSRVRSAQAAGITAPSQKPFETEELPDELPTATELLERRSKHFIRKRQAIDARALIPVRITCDGPFGIAHMGDPHVDDDGTDIDLLQEHVRIINQTDGLFAGNVGDFSNNWVGRLARLYGQQTTSAAEAWVLVEWLVRAVHWLYLVGGNHDQVDGGASAGPV
jgi:transposase-like protein